MNPIELQGQVLGLLERFKGIEPLKKLFWSILNYEQVNRPISRRGWPDTASSVLADDPILLAAGGEKNAFQVLYSRLSKDRLSLADERIVTSRLLKDHPYGLFVFSDKTQTNWHFLNVKMAEEEEKRKLFRRVTVGPNEKMRTASQVISQMDLDSVSTNPSDLSPLAIQERHDQAFDVEPVTEEFYRKYHSTFDKVKTLIKGFRSDERKHLFTQRLFNRLMFIAFIQKKGWLKFGGRQTPDYLVALWADYRKNGNKEMGFYHERLYNLFFHGLGAQDDVGIININRGGFIRDLIGSVPYLNGGLFEEDDDDKNGGIKVPDAALQAILHDLFDHFNFTVTEATPLDVEVAVDPEMLGKVFEELVTGRHETGSYYTPKPVVSFMCREALKGYLETNLTKEKREAIVRFVDEHEPGGLRDAESSLEVLRRIRVCDHACGSGAYLLGMLHELMDLRSCLFKTKQVDSPSSYDRKLEIIQRNLYGVDIDPFAVNIARLRLWLSLAVEFEGERPEPLPNLKFEIEEGDSVSAPGPQPTQGLMREVVVKQFSETKGRYIKAHGDAKKVLEAEVFALKRSIATWTHGTATVKGFDWPVEFAEVFAEGGFDIVVANPPYVRQELIIEQKASLKVIFPEVYNGTADLYVFFYARAIQILRPNGMLCFISSNKWFKANYGSNLRSHIAASTKVVSIVDFGELPVFKTAATFPTIFVCRKSNTVEDVTPRYTKVKSLMPPYPDINLLVRTQGTTLPVGAVHGSVWTLAESGTAAILKKMESSGIPLDKYVSGKLYYGIKTGLNKAFVIDKKTRDELIAADVSSRSLIKPLAVGDDVRKWRIDRRDRWLIFTRRGTNLSDFPAIKKYLGSLRSALEPRPKEWPKGKHWAGRKPGSYKWHEIQDEVAYWKCFEGPKIVFPDLAKESRFAFSPGTLYSLNTTYFIPKDDLYLLAVLNSWPMWFYCKERLTVMGDADDGGRLRFFRQFVELLPVPVPSEAERKKLSSLAQKCLDAEGTGCEKWETEINERVAALYGVDPLEFQPKDLSSL